MKVLRKIALVIVSLLFLLNCNAQEVHAEEISKEVVEIQSVQSGITEEGYKYRIIEYKVYNEENTPKIIDRVYKDITIEYQGRIDPPKTFAYSDPAGSTHVYTGTLYLYGAEYDGIFFNTTKGYYHGWVHAVI